MNTEKAKELLRNLGIEPEFNAMEWSIVWTRIRALQLDAHDRREYAKVEELYELERFISANGGDLHPFPCGGFFHTIPRGTAFLSV